ncbi:hypothetical protein GP475_08255 [Corynebacterium poyangense]|uniref:Uncharacterized protein n=2 Tax=Corynebacterium poyangense TaxID=2684405 RepID=A0A7H0SSE9_9CORY|nr:hypothetical protein [Corynebacterium poyangense]MBZ8178442.1 hypothetical protein [Corynebacterium poyangense]QNQ91474.1 hypothetical protein GP475_08255 [Corynebacterium poyangense]
MLTINPILITSPVCTRSDFYSAVGDALCHDQRPAPRNLDGLADLLREFRVEQIICAHWCLEESEEKALHRIFEDLNITLHR